MTDKKLSKISVTERLSTESPSDDLGFKTIAIIVLGALFALVCLVFIIVKVLP